MRSFQGRASEELYNEALSQLHNWLKTLHNTIEPVDAIDGALWIDKNNALKVKRENKFVTLYENVYQSMGQIIDPNEPLRPTPGQLWINEDSVLTYYDGINFKPVKAGTIEDFSMDGYEPFLIIDALHAGANEIIKKDANIIEEEFIAGEGATEFILQKGQYTTMQNKITVYVNGRIMPKVKYLEHSSTTIRLLTPLHKGERLMAQYLPKNKIQSSDYTPLKFHPALREEVVIVEEPTHFITLPSDCLMGEESMMLYINGRFVGNRYYTIDDARTIRIIAELEVNEEVLVQYIDQMAFDSIPDNEVAITEEIPYTQYIWPSSEYDRLFMNGKLNQDFETINKITIQYPSRSVQGKTVSAVHVHPKNICDIKKRVYSIDKHSGYVQADELDTEFYAITNNPIIGDADLEESNLYPSTLGSLVESSDATRSYVMHVQPSTEYVIKRSVISNVFNISEHNERPVVGGSYTDYMEITQVNELSATHVFTTGSETQYIIIHLSSNGGSWHAPDVKTNAKTSKSLLLVKTGNSDSDYVSVVGGIMLSEYIKNAYDYVIGITYVFGETTGRGHLSKVSFDITDDSQIIIGNVSDPLLVFAQGHYLIERDNYRYNSDTGKLTLLFPEQLDIGVITFPRYESGFILEQNRDGHGIIVLQKEFVKPLVFVYGEHIQQLADYTQDGNIIYIADAEIDMSYAVVDCVDAYGETMFLSEGEVLYDSTMNLHYVPVIANFDDAKPILFVNGLLINERDMFYEKNKLYIRNKADDNMRYTLLKDNQQRFLHSNIKQANTFATNVGADQAMLYVDGNLMGDIEAFGCMHLPEIGYQREIKGVMRYDTKKGYIIEEWYIYSGNEWLQLIDQDKVKELESYLAHYILEDKTVHFTNLNLIRGKRCTAWLYKYDETIEYPLMYYFKEMRDNTIFEVLPAHGYKMNQNCLSVYIDGYRQYPQMMNFPNGVKELTDHTFEIGTPVPGSRLEYIVELPERAEAKSCISEILTSDDVYNQTLKTNISLLPGFVEVFIDGVRQPKSSFEIVDRHSLVFNNFLKDPRFKNLILLEVRKDFFLKEATREITKDGQVIFACADDMRSLLFTKDFIKIYVNGVYVADDYDIIREHGSISISKINELGFAKKGHIVSFIWR